LCPRELHVRSCCDAHSMSGAGQLPPPNHVSAGGSFRRKRPWRPYSRDRAEDCPRKVRQAAPRRAAERVSMSPAAFTHQPGRHGDGAGLILGLSVHARYQPSRSGPAFFPRAKSPGYARRHGHTAAPMTLGNMAPTACAARHVVLAVPRPGDLERGPVVRSCPVRKRSPPPFQTLSQIGNVITELPAGPAVVPPINGSVCAVGLRIGAGDRVRSYDSRWGLFDQFHQWVEDSRHCAGGRNVLCHRSQRAATCLRRTEPGVRKPTGTGKRGSRNGRPRPWRIRKLNRENGPRRQRHRIEPGAQPSITKSSSLSDLADDTTIRVSWRN
jgi:hypothetical protein